MPRQQHISLRGGGAIITEDKIRAPLGLGVLRIHHIPIESVVFQLQPFVEADLHPVINAVKDHGLSPEIRAAFSLRHNGVVGIAAEIFPLQHPAGSIQLNIRCVGCIQPDFHGGAGPTGLQVWNR